MDSKTLNPPCRLATVGAVFYFLFLNLFFFLFRPGRYNVVANLLVSLHFITVIKLWLCLRFANESAAAVARNVWAISVDHLVLLSKLAFATHELK